MSAGEGGSSVEGLTFPITQNNAPITAGPYIESRESLKSHSVVLTVVINSSNNLHSPKVQFPLREALVSAGQYRSE